MTADGRPGAGPHRADTWVGAHEAICAYLDAVDGADLDRLVDLLEHATVVLPSGRITGGRAVREAYGPLLSRPGADGRRRTKHHLTNVVVSGPDEDGLLTAEAYYFVLEAGEDGPRLGKSGRFGDLLEPEERGGWRIREHHVIPDL